MEETDGRWRLTPCHTTHLPEHGRRVTTADRIMAESDSRRRHTPYAIPCAPGTSCPSPCMAPHETTRTRRSAGPRPHRRSTTCWLRTRCVPYHLVGQSTASLHLPLDMYRPTPHCRVGLPKRRLSEALSGTELRKPTKTKGYETWRCRNICKAAALRRSYNAASSILSTCPGESGIPFCHGLTKSRPFPAKRSLKFNY